MPATVMAERVGWPYSIRTLSSRVAQLRQVYLPPDPASRTRYVGGEIAQCDFWFPDMAVPVGFGQTRTATALPVLTMVTGYGPLGFGGAVIPTRRAEANSTPRSTTSLPALVVTLSRDLAGGTRRSCPDVNRSDLRPRWSF